MSSEKFSFWSLGGSGEVGMNSLFLDFGGTLVPIDAGVVLLGSSLMLTKITSARLLRS
jgi:hypothetical protein